MCRPNGPWPTRSMTKIGPTPTLSLTHFSHLPPKKKLISLISLSTSPLVPLLRFRRRHPRLRPLPAVSGAAARRSCSGAFSLSIPRRRDADSPPQAVLRLTLGSDVARLPARFPRRCASGCVYSPAKASSSPSRGFPLCVDHEFLPRASAPPRRNSDAGGMAP